MTVIAVKISTITSSKGSTGVLPPVGQVTADSNAVTADSNQVTADGGRI